MTATRSADDILREFGLPPAPPGKQRFYATCPRCSAKRIPTHQKIKCLGITIDGDGVKFGCNHCNWTDGAFFNGKAKGDASKPRARQVATYDYVDEVGNLLFQVVRFEPKTFRQRRPDGGGGFTWSVKGCRVVPYRLPEVIEAVATENVIYLVEGEKDVDRLRTEGLVATCNPMGAGKWRDELAEHFQDARVVIIPDNDDAGKAHAEQVAASLAPIVGYVLMLDLPGLLPKGDVSDWLDRGGTADALRELAQRAPRWAPEQQVDDTSPAPAGEQSAPARQLIQSSAEFVAGFVPPEYVVVGLLQRRFIYSNTGATGGGKTAVTLRLSACVAQGIIFAGREIKKARVLYAAAENPDDVRMRWIALAQHMGFDPDTIEVYFTGRFKISEMAAKLRAEAERIGGEFGLVVIDTSPAFFEGDDENSRPQMGNHARLLRSLIDVIPGGPAVVANCHPTKNANADNLLPAGGGTFLNEMDGNLTCARTDAITEVYWQGKFRGPDFALMHFLIRTVTHQDLKDSDGRLIPTVICEPISDQTKDDLTAAAQLDENAVLKFISENAAASHASIALAMGWTLYSGEPNKSKAGRHIKALIRAKLVKETRAGRYRLTPEGVKALVGETDPAEAAPVRRRRKRKA